MKIHKCITAVPVLALALSAAFLAGTDARADAVADFYKGKTVTIVVAAGPGGNYSVYSLLLSPYWKKYLPGHPTFIIQNMGGAGGTKAANYLANSAPNDGSYIGILESTTPLNARLRATGVKYDPSKFHYLGGADNTRSMFTVMKSAGVNTLEEAKTKQLLCGATGKGSTTYVTPSVVNYFLGTKFKMILGYRGMNGVNAAIDKGEVNCRAAVFASIENSRPHWITDKKVNFLVQVGSKREKDLPNVPLLTELAGNDSERALLKLISAPIALGRPYLAPPGIAADRLASLRKAFGQTVVDKGFTAEASKRRIDLSPMTWQETAQVVDETINAPKDVIARAKKVIPKKKRKKKK